MIGIVNLDAIDAGTFTGEPHSREINDAIVKILEGSKPAFVQRRLVYQIK